MLATLAGAVAWWRAHPAADWARIPARVVGASLVENTDAISAARPAILIHYAYAVDGELYHGTTPLDLAARVRYRALPREVQTLLSRKGYGSFNDLPPEVREMLRRRGIDRIETVPEALLDTLRAQGFSSVKDFPEDVRQMIRDGEYARAAQTMDHLVAERMVPLAERGETIASVAALAGGGVIEVRYDPENPGSHYVVRLPVLPGASGAILFSSVFLVLITHLTLIYPRVKGR